MKYDCTIIGGGVIGLTCAFRLARTGCRVLVLEKDVIGTGASGCAAGLLKPYSGGDSIGDSSRVAHEVHPEILNSSSAGARFPQFDFPAGSIIELTESASLHPYKFLQSTKIACAALGVDILENSPVASVQLRNLAAGSAFQVQLADRHFVSDQIVLAAGIHSTGIVPQIRDRVELSSNPRVAFCATLDHDKEMTYPKVNFGSVLGVQAGRSYVVHRRTNSATCATSSLFMSSSHSLTNLLDGQEPSSGSSAIALKYREMLLGDLVHVFPHLRHFTQAFSPLWATLTALSIQNEHSGNFSRAAFPVATFHDLPGLVLAAGHGGLGFSLSTVTADIVATELGRTTLDHDIRELGYRQIRL